MSISAAEDGGPEGILNAILASYLERNDRSPMVREQFLRAHPEQAAELRQFFADEDQVDGLIDGSEGEPAGTEADSRPGAAIAPPGLLTAGATFRDYEVLETLGQGGMGVVYKSRQKSLDRIVAVKMIRPSRHADAEEVQRFYGEAKAVAQFQHPHIVGVHEVGEHDGQPFFSMDFVDGQSLAKMISQNALPQRQAAEYMQKIAAAMQYAHDHGVLHRDIKPANVLIDQHGEPRLTDFGLAKRVECDSQLTATGTPMGTPSYMPPEQARGTWSDVGPHSDVYAMGATLYDLLVGRPPFRAPTWSELLLQVLHQEPVSPRDFDATIARDLETICLKCLQKRPSDRYASAQELADDLGRFLRNEPIQARPVSVVERTWRWCRRNPLAVAAIISLALGFVVAVIGYGNALQARREADASFQDARRAVDDLFTLLSEEKSINQPGLKPFRQRLLERARAYYQRFNERRPKDAKVSLEHAKNWSRLARVLQELESAKDARSAYEAACQELRRLEQADPENEEILEAIGTAFNDFGVFLFQQKEFTNSDACYEQAEKARRMVAEAHPEKAAVLANTIMNRASVQQALAATASKIERWEELRSLARQGMEEAQHLRQQLLESRPSDPQLQHDLAQGYYNIANLLKTSNQPNDLAEAERKLEHALKHFPRQTQPTAVSTDPAFDFIDSAFDHAVAQRVLGDVRYRRKAWEPARTSFEQAIAELKPLAVENINVPAYQFELGRAYLSSAVCQLESGRASQATEQLKLARQALERLMERFPENGDYADEMRKVERAELAAEQLREQAVPEAGALESDVDFGFGAPAPSLAASSLSANTRQSPKSA